MDHLGLLANFSISACSRICESVKLRISGLARRTTQIPFHLSRLAAQCFSAWHLAPLLLLPLLLPPLSSSRAACSSFFDIFFGGPAATLLPLVLQFVQQPLSRDLGALRGGISALMSSLMF